MASGRDDGFGSNDKVPSLYSIHAALRQGVRRRVHGSRSLSVGDVGMVSANFSIRVVANNPHRIGSITWRAGQLVAAMEGCRIAAIVAALASLERDTTLAGKGDPARWLTHFAGLESAESGKAMRPWIELVHDGRAIESTTAFRRILSESP